MPPKGTPKIIPPNTAITDKAPTKITDLIRSPPAPISLSNKNSRILIFFAKAIPKNNRIPITVNTIHKFTKTIGMYHGPGIFSIPIAPIAINTGKTEHNPHSNIKYCFFVIAKPPT